jgi:TfoX/Sxy family transcriptional regulator of competence genes
MAWIKVPPENHRLFHAALPKDPRVSTVQLFGSVAALVNGNMFGGLFERSALVKLSPEDLRDAMALDGSRPFDPMGTGRVMTNTVVLPETIMDEPGELAAWFRTAFAHVSTLPPKKKKGGAKAPTKPARTPAAAKSVTKRAAKPAAPARKAGKAAKAGARTARVSAGKGSRSRGLR